MLFREEVSGIAAGWTIREDYGKVRLSVRRRGQAAESITLPYVWSKSSRGDAYTRIRNIYVHWSQGSTLRVAAELAEGRSPSTVLNWPLAAANFQEQKLQHGNHIKPSALCPDGGIAVGLIGAE